MKELQPNDQALLKPGDLIKFSDTHICVVGRDGNMHDIHPDRKPVPESLLKKQPNHGWKNSMGKLPNLWKPSGANVVPDDMEEPYIKYDHDPRSRTLMGGEEFERDKDIPSPTITR